MARISVIKNPKLLLLETVYTVHGQLMIAMVRTQTFTLPPQAFPYCVHMATISLAVHNNTTQLQAIVYTLHVHKLHRVDMCIISYHVDIDTLTSPYFFWAQ